jgi:predicted RNase H-like HicB family nuclease
VKYAVVYERTARNYSAYVPDLPGCVATGSNREQIEREIRQAILLHVEQLRRDREPVPEPTAWSDVVEVTA